jgi:hypothetical protein
MREDEQSGRRDRVFAANHSPGCNGSISCSRLLSTCESYDEQSLGAGFQASRPLVGSALPRLAASPPTLFSVSQAGVRLGLHVYPTTIARLPLFTCEALAKGPTGNLTASRSDELWLWRTLRLSCRKRTQRMLLVGLKELLRGRKAPLEERKPRMSEKRLSRLWYDLPL